MPPILKPWKVNQFHFNELFGSRTEPQRKTIVTTSSLDEVVLQAVRYFNTRDTTLYYPSKSFSVAIIYAKLLNTYYNEPYYESLDDPNLLYSNDSYFKPYSSERGIFDKILEQVGWDFDLTTGWVPETINYFNEECLGMIDYELLNRVPSN